MAHNKCQACRAYKCKGKFENRHECKGGDCFCACNITFIEEVIEKGRVIAIAVGLIVGGILTIKFLAVAAFKFAALPIIAASLPAAATVATGLTFISPVLGLAMIGVGSVLLFDTILKILNRKIVCGDLGEDAFAFADKLFNLESVAVATSAISGLKGLQQFPTYQIVK